MLILLLFVVISTVRPRRVDLLEGFALEWIDDEQLDELLDVDEELDEDGFTCL